MRKTSVLTIKGEEGVEDVVIARHGIPQLQPQSINDDKRINHNQNIREKDCRNCGVGASKSQINSAADTLHSNLR